MHKQIQDGVSLEKGQNRYQSRAHVENLIVISDVKVLIQDIRNAIAATNVIVNTAIVPGVLLIPNRFVILENPIKGYNNVLTIADESSMSFGYNENTNRI